MLERCESVIEGLRLQRKSRKGWEMLAPIARPDNMLTGSRNSRRPLRERKYDHWRRGFIVSSPLRFPRLRSDIWFRRPSRTSLGMA